MPEATFVAARCVRCELELPIKASREAVWRTITEETNGWWLSDFHVLDADSVVELDTRPGGSGLIERRKDGGFLLWYTLQTFLPHEFKLQLVGNVAPDWGGPSTSNLSLILEETPEGCVLKVTDAYHGRVDEGSIRSTHDGWGRLFGEGLRPYVESAG